MGMFDLIILCARIHSPVAHLAVLFFFIDLSLISMLFKNLPRPKPRQKASAVNFDKTSRSKCSLPCRIKSVEPNQVKSHASHVLNSAIRFGTWKVRRLTRAWFSFVYIVKLFTFAELFRIAKGTRKATVVATATVVAGSFGGRDSKAVLSSDTGIEVDGESETIDPAYNTSLPIFETKTRSMTSISKAGLFLWLCFTFSLSFYKNSQITNRLRSLSVGRKCWRAPLIHLN